MKHSSRFPLLSLTAALLLALTAGGSWGEEDGVLGAWVLASDADGTEYYLKVRDAVEVETAAGGWLDGAAALSGLASYR